MKKKQKQENIENTENKADKKKMSSEIKFTIIAIILIAIFCIAMTPVTLQNDTYYTIKIGEHIDKYGIDMQDPFSWHQDLSYTYPHWAYDLATYYIYSLWGMTGIYIVTCILTVILGLSIYFVNCKLAKNKLISFILTIGTIYLIRGYITARAQLVTFILFVFTIYFIEKFLETTKKRYIVGLIVIPIIIANVHAAVFPFYFVLYLPYIGEYLIAVLAETIIYKKIKLLYLNIKLKIFEIIKNKEKQELTERKILETKEKVDRIKIKRTKELENPYKIKLVKNKNVKWLIIIMIICLFTGLLTPIEATPYTYLSKTLRGNTTKNINEHLPMTLSNDKDAMCIIVIILAILIFTKTKIRLSDLFMITGLCYLMLASRRQISMFGIIGVVVLNRLIVNLIENYLKEGTLREMLRIATTTFGTFLIVVFMLLLSYQFAKDKFDDDIVDKSTYPVDACDFILKNIDLGKARFYNEYNYGSYLLFRGIPVFIDSRADLYAPEFSGKEDDIFMDFINTSNIGVFYEDTFEKYDITHVITYKNSKVNMIITKTKDENYKELYNDQYFVIYERLNQSE